MPEYKRYIVFAFSQNYPMGGLSDVESSWDELEDAITHTKTLTEDFIEIIDRDTWEMVEDVR